MHKAVTTPARWFFTRLCVGAVAVLHTALDASICWSGEPDSTGHGIRYETDIGEQRTIALDGTSIILDARSTIRVVMLEVVRKMYLDEGQVAIRVGSGRVLPLSVHANRLTIEATEANFDVRRKADQTIVSVLEGEVEVTSLPLVASADSRIRVRAGTRIAVNADGEISSRSTVSAIVIRAWQQRRLVFRRDTLADIAAEFNRYNKAPKLRVESDILKNRRCGGVFSANDPETFLEFLARDPRIEIDRSESEFITIRLRDADVQLTAE